MFNWFFLFWIYFTIGSILLFRQFDFKTEPKKFIIRYLLFILISIIIEGFILYWVYKPDNLIDFLKWFNWCYLFAPIVQPIY